MQDTEKIKELEEKISLLTHKVNLQEEKISFLTQQLNFALDNLKRNDSHGCLAKSRLILEKIVNNVYLKEMHEDPKYTELHKTLSNNQFTGKIEKRIISRMNYIRDFGNLGTHGEDVELSDATSVLDSLSEIIEWYFKKYLSEYIKEIVPDSIDKNLKSTKFGESIPYEETDMQNRLIENRKANASSEINLEKMREIVKNKIEREKTDRQNRLIENRKANASSEINLEKIREIVKNKIEREKTDRQNRLIENRKANASSEINLEKMREIVKNKVEREKTDRQNKLTDNKKTNSSSENYLKKMAEIIKNEVARKKSVTEKGDNFQITREKILPVILLIDASGSMSGDRIRSVNNQMARMIKAFSNIKTEGVQIFICVITYSNEVTIHLPYQNANSAKWEDIIPQGSTSLGKGLVFLKDILFKISGDTYRPSIILITDGLPTDNWEFFLTDFLEDSKKSQYDLWALGIGDDAPEEILNRFANSEKLKARKVKNHSEISSFFNLLIITTIYRSRSHNPNNNEMSLELRYKANQLQ